MLNSETPGYPEQVAFVAPYALCFQMRNLLSGNAEPILKQTPVCHTPDTSEPWHRRTDAVSTAN